MQVRVTQAVSVFWSVDVTVATCVVRMVVVLATGTTRILIFRMAFLIILIFLMAVVVEVGTFLTVLVPRIVVQVAGLAGPARVSTPSARSNRSGLRVTIVTEVKSVKKDALPHCKGYHFDLKY